MGYAESVVRTYSARIRIQGSPRMRAVPFVDARIRVWYNSSLQSRNFVIPGLIAVILMILSGMLTTLTIAREWEMGAMEQILSTPLRPSEMVDRQNAGIFRRRIVDSIIALVVGVTIFRRPFPWQHPVAGHIHLLVSLQRLFLGILISAGSRTQVEAYQWGMLVTFLPGFLSVRICIFHRYDAEGSADH